MFVHRPAGQRNPRAGEQPQRLRRQHIIGNIVAAEYVRCMVPVMFHHLLRIRPGQLSLRADTAQKFRILKIPVLSLSLFQIRIEFPCKNNSGLQIHLPDRLQRIGQHFRLLEIAVDLRIAAAEQAQSLLQRQICMQPAGVQHIVGKPYHAVPQAQIQFHHVRSQPDGRFNPLPGTGRSPFASRMCSYLCHIVAPLKCGGEIPSYFPAADIQFQVQAPKTAVVTGRQSTRRFPSARLPELWRDPCRSASLPQRRLSGCRGPACRDRPSGASRDTG